MPYTRAELLAAGLKPNHRIWLGNGWLYCPGCTVYTRHDPWGEPGTLRCFEVCGQCGTYHGRHQLEARCDTR